MWGLPPPRILPPLAEILLPLPYRKLRDKTAEFGHFLRTICFSIIFLEKNCPQKVAKLYSKKKPLWEKKPYGQLGLKQKKNFLRKKKKFTNFFFFFFNTVNPLRKNTIRLLELFIRKPTCKVSSKNYENCKRLPCTVFLTICPKT